MEQLQAQIEVLQVWLRDHPNAPLEARHDKIIELGQLKTDLETLKNKENDHYNIGKTS